MDRSHVPCEGCGSVGCQWRCGLSREVVDKVNFHGSSTPGWVTVASGNPLQLHLPPPVLGTRRLGFLSRPCCCRTM